jgi:hypothetical protein
MKIERALGCLGCLFWIFAVGGCTGSGSSDASTELPAGTYGGLANQQAAVLVWADFGTRTEYNQIQLDTTRLLTGKLEALGRPAKQGGKERPANPALAGVQFLHHGSVVRYQREHPEVWTMSIEQVAPRLGVPRVIFIELVEFQTAEPAAFMLLKGKARANLRVLQIAGGKATTVFEENDITANFPPQAPEGVVASERFTVRTVYEGTLDLLTDKIAARFATPKD